MLRHDTQAILQRLQRKHQQAHCDICLAWLRTRLAIAESRLVIAAADRTLNRGREASHAANRRAGEAHGR
jgi:hypothetical protein